MANEPVAAEQTLKDRIIASSVKAMEAVDDYLAGNTDDREKAMTAFRILSQGVKVMQMMQVRMLTERSQALRLVKFLPNDEARAKYIALTNPQAAPLLLDKPKKVA